MGDGQDVLRLCGSRLAADPGDLTALEELRTGVGEADVDSRLAPAIVNLVDRLLDGTVAPDARTAALLAEACLVPSGASAERRSQLIERLDLAASGMADVLLGTADAPFDEPAAGEPPLLTVRHDGTRVTPGSFDVDAVVETAHVAPLATAVGHIVDAFDTAVDRLRGQVGTLDLLAAVELRRLVGEFRDTAEEMGRLKDSLAQWVDDNAALLRTDDG